MLNQLFKNPRYTAYAILVHIAFVVIIVVSLDWRSKPHPMQHPENVIQAVAIDESKVQAELDKLQAAEKRKQQEAEARRKAQEKKVQEAKETREREEKRIVEVQKQREEEQLKLKEQQAKLEDQAKKAKELEQNQKIEAERLETLKKEQEALDIKRKQEEQRLAEEKRKQDEQRALQEQMAAEQQQLEAEHQKKVQSVVDQYIGIIQQKVARNWFKPAAARQGLSCTVKVRLIPGGEVLDAHIVSSSGDPVFDRSVETAVLKASPLPLPPDTSLFENFRDLTFLFKPEE
jgi:colicin import membrane protein